MFGEAETPKEPSAVIRYTADIMTLPRPGGLQERGCPLGLGELFANNISTGEHCGQGLEEKSKQQEQVPPHLDDTKSSKEQPKSACISCRIYKWDCSMDPEACSQCIARGSVCSYRPPKSRGRPNKKQPLHRVIDTKHSIGRPNIACDACRHSKVKCTMDPAGCSRCTRRHYHCSYPARNNHGGRPSTEEEAQRRDRGREEWRSGSGWGKSGGGAEGAGIADPSLLVGVDDLIAGDAPVGFVAPGVKSKAAGAEVSSGHGGVEWDRGGDGIRPAGRYRRLLPKLAYPEGPGMFFG